jgi:hypothetical protein
MFIRRNVKDRLTESLRRFLKLYFLWRGTLHGSIHSRSSKFLTVLNMFWNCTAIFGNKTTCLIKTKYFLSRTEQAATHMRKLTANELRNVSSMRLSVFCRTEARRTSCLLQSNGAVTRREPHLLLPVSQLLNEAASPMTSLPRLPIKPLPTHTPPLLAYPLPLRPSTFFGVVPILKIA